MLLAVVASRFIARVVPVPAPLVQIALGAAIYHSRLTSVELDPEVFFVLLLPPLLFLDGWRLPNDALKREARTILRLAVGLVVFTVLGVGLLIHAMIPGLPLPVAFALAAVLSPTDPVALSALAGPTPMPTRLRHILEGESLFNDASGLVCMRFAVAAMLTGEFSLPTALATFLWVALGGLAIGVAVTWLVTRARPSSAVLLGDDGAAQILSTLLIPSGVYVLAEAAHCSGILAAVAAGITMSFGPHSHWQATTRIRRTAVWDTVQFAANGAIFVLLGEQLPSIYASAARTVRLTGHGEPWWLAVYVALIVLALAVLRFVWVALAMRSAFAQARRADTPDHSAYGRLVGALSFGGVRGAITLAGVLTLPLTLRDGTPFPGRDLAIVLSAGVIIVSLVLAAITLPRALRGLVLPVDPAHRGAERILRLAAAQAGLAALQAAQEDRTACGVIDELRDEGTRRLSDHYRQRIDRYGQDEDDEDDDAPDAADRVEQELRLIGLRAERDAIVRLPRSGVPEESLRTLVREIDLLEARYGG